MPVKKHSVEQIIAKLREIEKLTGQGMAIPLAANRVGVPSRPSTESGTGTERSSRDAAERLQLLEQESGRPK